jgi:hypothetical protein
MLDAGCWILDKKTAFPKYPVYTFIQHPETRIQYLLVLHPASSKNWKQNLIFGYKGAYVQF